MSPSSVCARRHFHVGPVSAGLENLPRALDPRWILFPQSTLPSFRCPARNNSARVPSPMDGADASSPARGQRVHWTLAFRLPRAAPATSPAHSASSPSTEQSVQHSHSISALARRVYSLLSVSSESQETPPPLPSLARELLSGELSRHRPPPPEAAPGAPSRRHKATRVFFPANPTLHRPPHLPPDAPSTTPRPSPSHSVSSSANTVDRPWSASCQRLRRRAATP